MVYIDELADWALERWTMDDYHGLPHWQRVETNGIRLCAGYNTSDNSEEIPDLLVVRCFAYLHDAGRMSNHEDPEHGLRSAEIAATIRDTILRDLSGEQFEKLVIACREHTRTQRTGDITIDTCFDADRLDLPRAGIIPDPKKMATVAGAEIARKEFWNNENEII